MGDRLGGVGATQPHRSLGLHRRGHLLANPDCDFHKESKDLTDRERSGLGYLPTRLSNRETASELYVSLNTLKTHLQSTTANLASIAEPQQSTHLGLR